MFSFCVKWTWSFHFVLTFWDICADLTLKFCVIDGLGFTVYKCFPCFSSFLITIMSLGFRRKIHAVQFWTWRKIHQLFFSVIYCNMSVQLYQPGFKCCSKKQSETHASNFWKMESIALKNVQRKGRLASVWFYWPANQHSSTILLPFSFSSVFLFYSKITTYFWYLIPASCDWFRTEKQPVYWL